MTEYTYGKYTLRPYQIEAYEAIGDHIRKINRFKDIPKEQLIGSFIEASVGSGKTSIAGAILSRFVEMGWPCLCLARDLKLVEQNAETFWDMRVKNSIYSAAYSKAMKYAESGVIVSNEATAYNAVFGEGWRGYAPRALIIDECHQVGVDKKDSQYMSILTELNRRCIEKYGHRIIMIGLTGSPYRHTMSIIGDVWQDSLYSIDTATLVGMGFLVPTIFGADVGHDKSLDYDMSKYSSKSDVGTSDFSKSEMAAMEKEMIADSNKLRLICNEVVRLTKDRNAVMITCAGVKHCKEVAKFLPQGQSAIVYSGQRKSVNDSEIERIEKGEAKYLLQVGCLTTGFDCPVIDTSVILRKIGSLTLLVQLLGRGMRLLKPNHEEAGLTKKDHLVLDYSGTMDEMSWMYENPILDECRLHEDKAGQKETHDCPDCGTENSLTARRCIGRADGKRCEFFFSFVECQDQRSPNGMLMAKGCGTKNDTRSKVCRKCNNWLVDPNENLMGNHYTANDLINVTGFSFGLTRDESKVLVTYQLENGKRPRELFDLAKKEKWARTTWIKFVNEHVDNAFTKKALISCRNPKTAMQYAGEIKPPKQITHRVNDRKFDIIARKVFE
jgi:superfamily II DNA or RNA helicase